MGSTDATDQTTQLTTINILPPPPPTTTSTSTSSIETTKNKTKKNKKKKKVLNKLNGASVVVGVTIPALVALTEIMPTIQILNEEAISVLSVRSELPKEALFVTNATESI